MDYVEFLSCSFGGKNWVLARRSMNVVRKYGEDVICISRKRYAEVEKDYRAIHGDPHDKPRAAMYLALRAIRDHLEAGDNCRAVMIALANAAISEELMA